MVTIVNDAMSTFVCEHEFDPAFISMCSRNPMYSSVFGQNLI
jgi:hypothetical protein